MVQQQRQMLDALCAIILRPNESWKELAMRQSAAHIHLGVPLWIGAFAKKSSSWLRHIARHSDGIAYRMLAVAR